MTNTKQNMYYESSQNKYIQMSIQTDESFCNRKALSTNNWPVSSVLLSFEQHTAVFLWTSIKKLRLFQHIFKDWYTEARSTFQVCISTVYHIQSDACKNQPKVKQSVQPKVSILCNIMLVEDIQVTLQIMLTEDRYLKDRILCIDIHRVIFS